MTVFAFVVAVTSAILLISALIFFLECFASLFLSSGGRITRPDNLSVAVLIPAHDERQRIGATVTGVRSQLSAGDRLVVIADNCTDDTADIARAAGAEVITRTESEHRGKGYALAFGIDHLESDHPDVVIIVDADCWLTPGTVDTLVERSTRTQRPVQADYVSRPAERSALSMVSVLAILVHNRVRPRGLHRVGLPCHLMGTGMAFPWEVMRSAPHLGANLVEDLVMGIELALLGHEPLLCIEAGIRSELPRDRRVAMQQRRRWEHGQMGTLLQYGLTVIGAGIRRGRPGLVALGADLIVPPLALLVLLLVLVSGIAGVVVLAGGPSFPAWIAGTALTLVGLGVAIGWARYGRKAVPFRYLLFVPLYVIWKIPLYVSFLFGRRERQWRRTQR